MRGLYLIGLLMFVLSACAPSVAEPIVSGGTPASAGSTLSESALLPEEPPPAGAEAEFSTDFSRHTVPYSEILSGGVPRDGIKAIDQPRFVSVDEADEWVEDQEPVVVVEMEGEARAYPIQILTWHEIVNDTVGGVPVAVTYCPLCNTAIAFERTHDGLVLDFGTTGRLRYSNLVMYDRQTETWWQQATGAAIAGELVPGQLTFVPASMISWSDFKSAYEDGQVLSRETGYARDYGRNPYVRYDDPGRSPFLYDGPDTPGALSPMARVVTVDLDGETVAYPYELLQEVRVINDTVGGMPIVVFWAPGTASALDSSSVADGEDVGAATTYSRQLGGQILTFAVEGDHVVDDVSGSHWDVLGRALEGPEAGSQLDPVVSVNHFWFSWAAFRPETRIYAVGGQQAEETVEEHTPASGVLPDFQLEVYQGEEVLGGRTVAFSEVLAQGKPVVLNFWAGLCPICRAEMPRLQEVHNEYSDSVLFLGVDIGPFVQLGTVEDGLALMSDLGITYPTGAAGDAGVIRDYGILGTPSTLFITPDGNVIQRWNGAATESQLVEFIQALLEASAD